MKKNIKYEDIIDEMAKVETARSEFIKSIYDLKNKISSIIHVNEIFYNPNDTEDVVYQRYLFGQIHAYKDTINDLDEIIKHYELKTRKTTRK